MERGEIWWVNLREPIGSEPGFRRPALIVSSDNYNMTRIQTVIILVLTSNLRVAASPGNVLVRARESGLPVDSVVNVTQIIAADKSFLSEYVGRLSVETMEVVSEGLRLAMGL